MYVSVSVCNVLHKSMNQCELLIHTAQMDASTFHLQS